MLENCRLEWHPLLCLAGRSGLCATIFILKYLQLSHFDPLPPWNCGWSPLLFRCYTFCCLSHVLPFNPPPLGPLLLLLLLLGAWSLSCHQSGLCGPPHQPDERLLAFQKFSWYPYFSYFLFWRGINFLMLSQACALVREGCTALIEKSAKNTSQKRK